MKKPYLKTTVRGVSALALLALSLWFGLLPYYRLAALLVAALILPVLLRPEWTFSIVLAALIGCGASLWAFRASGYHYASLLPFLVAALMLVFRFGKRGLKRLAGAATALVLGAAVYGEDPSLSLVHRSDRAMEHLETNPSAVAVLSGGQGEGEDISEAECMGRYLKSKGVNEGRMLLEDRSTSTLENLTFSKQIIENSGGDPARVAVVSSSYHLYRARRMAAALGMAADGLPSSDGYPVYMTGMYLREAVAVWKLWVLGT